jgi:hypothetical protein
MIMRTSVLVCALLLGAASCAPARQEPAVPAPTTVSLPERPLPQPVVPPAGYRRAVERGTRSETGRPGERYWQQWASYRLEARLLPERRRLEGRAQIWYHNRSPDALQTLQLELAQNLHAPGVARNEPVEITGGVQLRRVALAGRELRTGVAQGSRYIVQGTRLVLIPAAPVASGDSIMIAIDYDFTIPQAGGGERMGYVGDDLYFLAYWYPQMSVYDDVVGWHPDPFLSLAEFYHGFASYDITIDAPSGWLVRSTGRQLNEAETFTPQVLQRLQRAAQSDSVITVLSAADLRTSPTRAGTGGRVRWQFRADSVRDVSFSATRRSIWDVARTPVGDRTGDGTANHTRIEALYRETAPRWRQVARYSQHAITFFSEYLGIPYPWPHMTALEGGGIIGGGMEFPMMTIMGDYNAAGDSALYYVTAHELAHMWVPMIVSTDERRYSWFDEGITSFNENQARNDFFPGIDHNLPDQQTYINFARTGEEGEMMRWSNHHHTLNAYIIASYMKPATVLHALRGVLGEETFDRAFREFMSRWAYRHPYPWDMWRTFEDVSGRDLEWFWRSWYYETWTLDQAIASVRADGARTTIVVEDRGNVPMPVRLAITTADGQLRREMIPVDEWLTGARSASLTVQTASPVVRVEIDPERYFPDVDRDNNRWERP